MKVLYAIFAALSLPTALAASLDAFNSPLKRQVQGQIPKDAKLGIKKVETKGDACPVNTTGIIRYLDERTITIIFDKFKLFAVPEYASGFRRAIITDLMRGDLTLNKDAICRIGTGLSGWTPEVGGKEYTGKLYQLQLDTPYNGDFGFTRNYTVEMQYPRCSLWTNIVKMAYEININNAGRDTAQAILFSIDYTVTVDVPPRSDCPKSTFQIENAF